jgi:D-alanyl-D-alanine carboxypeptidase
VPKSGDGDLWPTTDDDKPSGGPEDGSTQQLPVPDQREEPPAAAQANAGWFDPPGADTPEEPSAGRDEPHAKPAQQRTQPVSWPVAELEKHVKNPDAEATSFVRPLPPTPAWPGQTDSSRRDDPPSFIRPEKAAALLAEAQANHKPPADPSPATPSSSEPAGTEPASETDRAQAHDAEAASQDGTDQVSEAEVPDRADTEAAGRAWPEQAQEVEAADPAQTGEAAAAGDRADQTREVEAGQAHEAEAAEQARAAQTRAAEAPSRAGWPSETEPAGRTQAGQGSGHAGADQARETEAAGDSWFAPRESKPADQETKRISLDSLAPGRPVNLARPGAQDSTAIIRRPEPQDTAANRARPTDSATVNLARPSLLKPDRQAEWPPPEPPRAAPQRVGLPPEPPAAKKAPRKKLLVTAIAVVAVIGIAAGVVFGVPGLSEKLGLTGEEAVAIDPPPAPISYTPGLRGPDASAPAPTKQGIETALAGPIANPALGTLTGTVIDPVTGETLYERDASSAITPASTGKILTAAAALLSMDHTKQLVTKVVQGEQPGEVIIVGGGDPTISSLKVGSESMYPGAPHLSELVEQVKNSGAEAQTVYIDQSRYAEPRLARSWLPADIAAGYIAPIVPAMLDGDRRDATVNYSPRTNDPGQTLVNEFAARLGAAPAASIEKKAQENAKVLGEIRSAPMTQLVDNMLDRSDNTLGDILAHEIAVQAGEEPSFDGASKAMLDVLRQNNFDVEGVELKDGSGMSEANKMSARLLAQVLAVAAGPDGKDPRTAKLRPLLGGLPVAGGSGTLADRYDEGAATEGRGWVRAKTGTLTGVNSLAGIVLDKDNRPLVFAFLTTGTASNTARSALDAVSAALRSCGCQ